MRAVRAIDGVPVADVACADEGGGAIDRRDEGARDGEAAGESDGVSSAEATGLATSKPEDNTLATN